MKCNDNNFADGLLLIIMASIVVIFVLLRLKLR